MAAGTSQPHLDPLLAKTSFDPARRAFLNGCVNFVRGVLNVAVVVALTPFLVSHLGAAGFGVWSLLSLFISYVTIVDLGISGAAAKFIGELSPQRDLDRMNRLFASVMALLGGLAAGVLVCGTLLRHSLEASLAMFGLLGENARVFLVGAVALYVVGLVSNGFYYMLLGLHRLDVANYIAASVLLAQAAGTLVVLGSGLGLKGLIGLMVITSGVSIAAYFLAARKLAPRLRFSWKDLNFATAKKLVSFGLFLQAYALVGFYYFYVGKAVVSLRSSLAAVAAYEVALRLPILLRQGVLTMLGPMMPAVSHLDARGGAQEVRGLLVKALRYSLLLGTPIFVSVAIFAGPIIRIWVGQSFADSVLPLRILSIALGLSVFPDLVWFFLVGLGRQRLAVIFSLGQMIFGTLLSYALAARWGLVGVAVGVLITSLVGVPLYAALIVREKVLLLSDLPVSLGCRVIVMSGAAYLIVFELVRRFPLSYWSVALALFLASVAYYLWVAKNGILHNHERLFLRRLVPSPLHFLC